MSTPRDLLWRPGTQRPAAAGALDRDDPGREGGTVVYNPYARLSLSQQRMQLPIFQSRRQLLYMVERYRAVVVVGHTGCGKTTQLPQYLHEAGWTGSDFQVACTQPRRVAATSVAARVAEEMGEPLGAGAVGYSVRFDDCCGVATRIKYMTDGMLIRETMSDPLLSRYSVIMLDEAHERSVHTDVLLGLLRRVQRKRPELRLVIASATVDAQLFKDFFETNRSADAAQDSASILSLPGGGVHEVSMHFAEAPLPDYLEYAVHTAWQIHESGAEGDILVFLTGQRRWLKLREDSGPSPPWTI